MFRPKAPTKCTGSGGSGVAVSTWDVLVGRGRSNQSRLGNAYFQELVHFYRGLYFSNNITIQQKQTIVLHIIDSIEKHGGTFLKEVPTSTTSEYVPVSLHEAKQKVAHALQYRQRQHIEVQRRVLQTQEQKLQRNGAGYDRFTLDAATSGTPHAMEPREEGLLSVCDCWCWNVSKSASYHPMSVQPTDQFLSHDTGDEEVNEAPAPLKSFLPCQPLASPSMPSLQSSDGHSVICHERACDEFDLSEIHSLCSISCYTDYDDDDSIASERFCG